MIDYKDLVNQKQKALDEFLASRKSGIDTSIGNIQSNIEADRNQNLGDAFSADLGNLAQGYNLGQGAVTSGQIGAQNQSQRLGVNLQANLGQKKYGLNQERINLIFNSALDQAENAGMERQQAEAFARDFVSQEIARQTQGQANETARQQAIKQQSIKNSYGDSAMNLENSFQPDSGLNNALISVLTGMPVQIASSYYFNNKLKNMPQASLTPTPSAPTAGVGGYGYPPENPYSGLTKGKGVAGTNF